jgi:hypothetical protein
MGAPLIELDVSRSKTQAQRGSGLAANSGFSAMALPALQLRLWGPHYTIVNAPVHRIATSRRPNNLNGFSPAILSSSFAVTRRSCRKKAITPGGRPLPARLLGFVHLLSLRALYRVNQQARPGVVVAHIALAMTAPIGLVQRNLVATGNALNLFFAHAPPLTLRAAPFSTRNLGRLPAFLSNGASFR